MPTVLVVYIFHPNHKEFCGGIFEACGFDVHYPTDHSLENLTRIITEKAQGYSLIIAELGFHGLQGFEQWQKILLDLPQEIKDKTVGIDTIAGMSASDIIALGIKCVTDGSNLTVIARELIAY